MVAIGEHIVISPAGTWSEEALGGVGGWEGPAPSQSVPPRRSHALGACRTCRRRHVKCDQEQPACRTCCSVGVACEGFSSEFRWVHIGGGSSGADDLQGRGRFLYTGDDFRLLRVAPLLTRILEQSRLSMSSCLSSDLISGSVNASLA